jgi:hypothetical protein
VYHIFDSAPVKIREDLYNAIGVAHSQLGKSGDWILGTDRTKIMAEVRNAQVCKLCFNSKNAMSPYSITGDHDTLTNLPNSWINIIHRVTTDSGRLSKRWFLESVTSGLSEYEFIEIVSVCVQTIAIDIFALGIGAQIPPLPKGYSSAPGREITSGAKIGPGWISTVDPKDADAELSDFYGNDNHFYIRRSMTLLPKETIRLWALLDNLYLEDPRIHELEGKDRGISRGQMEFLAARASALLGCLY